MKNRICCLLLILIFSGCKSGEKESTKSVELADLGSTKIIGHKGSGTFGAFGNEVFYDNSLKSILNAINHTNGSEFDLQLSADTTLWLFHDHFISNCSNEKVNFALLTDSEIQTISNCNFFNELVNLKDFTDSLRLKEISDKFLSLDLKVLQNDSAILRFGGKYALAKIVAQKILVLNALKGIEVMVEVPFEEQISLLDSISGFPVYFLSPLENGSINKNGKYSLPISHALESKEDIMGKDLQLWTANAATEMIDALNLKPQFIQSDNIPLASFFLKTKAKDLKYVDIIDSDFISIGSSDEYYMIKKISLSENEAPFLLSLSFGSPISFSQNTIIVFSATNDDGESIYWEGHEPSNKIIYEFVNSGHLINKNCDELKVYIWNREKESINISNVRLGKYYFP